LGWAPDSGGDRHPSRQATERRTPFRGRIHLDTGLGGTRLADPHTLSDP
jgi:hypothetical protein